MLEFDWLFWLLIVFLFAESWARVWAAAHRSDEHGPASRGSLHPDI